MLMSWTCLGIGFRASPRDRFRPTNCDSADMLSALTLRPNAYACGHAGNLRAYTGRRRGQVLLRDCCMPVADACSLLDACECEPARVILEQASPYGRSNIHVTIAHAIAKHFTNIFIFSPHLYIQIYNLSHINFSLR